MAVFLGNPRSETSTGGAMGRFQGHGQWLKVETRTVLPKADQGEAQRKEQTSPESGIEDDCRMVTSDGQIDDDGAECHRDCP
jgi:hypothetical protein